MLMKKQTYLDYISNYLDEQAFEQFKATYQQKISKSIKIIEKRIQKSDFFSLVKRYWRELTPPDLRWDDQIYNDVVFVHKEDTKTLGSHFLHQSWYFYIQEVAAGLSAQILDVKKWNMVLDLCAAPGGKSVQIADKLSQLWWGFLLSNEPSNPRRKALIFNLNRCWLANTAVSAYQGQQIWELVSEVFDKVLVDAPCSGEGMQYKSDSKTTYRDEKNAQQLSKLQIQLLISGLKALKVWWELVYSTCTLNALENEQVIAALLKQFPNQIELLPVEINQKSAGLTHYWWNELLPKDQAQKVARFWPHIQHTGGFFIAKFRKNSSLPTSAQIDQRTQQETWYLSSTTLQDEIRSYLRENRGIEQQSDFYFLSNDNAVYLTTKEATTLPKGIFIEKFWIPIFKKGHSGELIPQQWLVATLWSFAQKNIIEITDQQAQKFLDKQDIVIENWWNGWFLITKREWKPFCLVKQVGNILKNKLY